MDPSIDLTPVIPALIKGGYDGIIATEYEGQRMVDDIMPFSAMEMVRKFAKRLIFVLLSADAPPLTTARPDSPVGRATVRA